MRKIVVLAVVFCLLLASCSPAASEAPPLAYEPEEYEEYIPEQPEPEPVAPPPEEREPEEKIEHELLAQYETVDHEPPAQYETVDHKPPAQYEGIGHEEPPAPEAEWTYHPVPDRPDRWGPPLTPDEFAERLRTTAALPPEGMPNQVILAHYGARYWTFPDIDFWVEITDPVDIAQIVQLLRNLQPLRMYTPILAATTPTLTLVYGDQSKEYGLLWHHFEYAHPNRTLVFFDGRDYTVDMRFLQIIHRYAPTR